ncbi:MAG TPA: flagellar protein FlaG [Methylococcaceae bacterium]|nr:flagellar protein FlaG [Methylococcaceae bacterium]
MGTANAISSIYSVGSSLLRRPSNGEASARPVGETPPSGVTQVGIQTVTGAGNAENSGLSDQGRNPDKKDVACAVKNMNDFLQRVRRTLQFSMDEDSGKIVVQIKDQETDQVIRQIPPEFMLKLAEQMDKFKGLLFAEKA